MTFTDIKHICSTLAENDTVRLKAQFNTSEERMNTRIRLQEDNLDEKISITGKHILFFFYFKNAYQTMSF